MSSRTEKFEQLFTFLSNKEKENKSFTVEDMEKEFSWKTETVKTYLSKKLKSFVLKKNDKEYLVSGLLKFDTTSFSRMMSQVKNLSDEPFKPILSENVERLVIKARESAILAVDIYNRPASLFRVEGFIVMMIISWTSLLHAFFEKTGQEYYYIDKNTNQPIEIGGDKKTWELLTCIEKMSLLSEPVKKNIQFIINLRNKIEHRFVPNIDMDVIGYCQALLLNFEELLCKEFGDYYALKDLLSFPIQTISKRNTKQVEVIKKLQSNHYQEIRNYITVFEKDIKDEIYQDPNYSFRVYLIPKQGNHERTSDVSIDFIKYDPSNPDVVKNLEKQIALIKEKKVPISNKDKLKPSKVAELVSIKTEKKFTVRYHTNAWKIYKIRSSEKTHEGCNTKYCVYDEVHNDFVYTEEWVGFLCKELSDDEKYKSIISYK